MLYFIYIKKPLFLRRYLYTVMKKIFKATMAAALAACVLTFSSCADGGRTLHTSRYEVNAMSIYCDEDEYLIPTYTGEWLRYKTDGTAFIEEEASTEGLSATWVRYDYYGRLTEEKNFYTELSYPHGEQKTDYAQIISSFLGDEVTAANVAVIEGYAYINVYSEADGDNLYMEKLTVSYLGYISEAGEFTLYETYTDGRVFLLYTDTCAVYERNNKFYSYTGGKEILLFADKEYDKPLQHDNKMNIYYTGANMYFERFRDCAGYILVTYTLATIDGSCTVDMYSKKLS